MEIKKRKQVFLLPLPAAGHLTSMMEMAARLLAVDPELSFTVLIMTTPIPNLRFTGAGNVKSIFSVLGDVSFIELNVVDLPQHVREFNEIGAVCSLYVDSHKLEIKAAMSRFLRSNAGGGGGGGSGPKLIIDFFATMVIDVAEELGVSTYLYFTGGAAFLALMLYSPVLDEQRKLPVDVYEDDGGVVEIPGLPPIPVQSIPTFMISSRMETYQWFLYHGRRFRETKGMILNTFSELEPTILEAIADGLLVPEPPPVYTIGPVLGIRERSKEEKERHPTVKWLDGKRPRSVVFLCFGSTGVFTARQLTEMAEALQGTDYDFLWCVNKPTEVATVEDVLPEGWAELTAGRGLVWMSWAPQVEILSHASVGGFVTHCGWNSCLESLWFGVPMLGWPCLADQYINAFSFARDVGAMLELAVDRRNGNFVCGEDLERGLRSLMEEEGEEGRRVRRRAAEMKEWSRRAMASGGTSHEALKELVSRLVI